jgi:hypothetical protein
MKNLKHYFIKGFLFVVITGSIAHFVYDWSGENTFLGFLFPINESIWEHMKLCFFPMLLYSFYLNTKLEDTYPCIRTASLFGIILSTFLIPVLFYTYSGILGHNYAILDIMTFIISVLLAFIVMYKLTTSCTLASYKTALTILVLILAICFFIFTYRPLNIGNFADPTVPKS